jgi:hypothetical protein
MSTGISKFLDWTTQLSELDEDPNLDQTKAPSSATGPDTQLSSLNSTVMTSQTSLSDTNPEE